MTQLNNLHKDVRTNHVVEPDVPADGVVGVLLPAGPHVPQPGLVVEDAEAVDEHDGVEDEPPAALAELGEGGGGVLVSGGWGPRICCVDCMDQSSDH